MSDDGAPAPVGSDEIADRRAEFARLSRPEGQSPREFVEHKILLVRTDPTLTEEEKAAAIADLQRVLDDG